MHHTCLTNKHCFLALPLGSPSLGTPPCCPSPDTGNSQYTKYCGKGTILCLSLGIRLQQGNPPSFDLNKCIYMVTVPDKYVLNKCLSHPKRLHTYFPSQSSANERDRGLQTGQHAFLGHGLPR